MGRSRSILLFYIVFKHCQIKLRLLPEAQHEAVAYVIMLVFHIFDALLVQKRSDRSSALCTMRRYLMDLCTISEMSSGSGEQGGTADDDLITDTDQKLGVNIEQRIDQFKVLHHNPPPC